MKAHENLLVFYDKTPVYNPQKSQGHSPVHTYTKRAEICNQTEVYGKVKVNVSGGGDTDRYPRSVIVFSSDKQKNKMDGTLHPTQKPLALCEYIIKTYTNEGALVLDNCAGSGTIGLAAKKTNRNFILIEKEEKYCELSKRRIGG
jgi:site-specific DNA-methyltransferase (adenine-specific)